MKKWEYKSRHVITKMSDKELNELGAEGWELVAVDSRSASSDRAYVFKREICQDK